MESVRTGLRQIMSDLLRARPAEEAVILAWPLVCGTEVAARTQAVSFRDGSLTVEVPDATWRNQLAAFAPRYLRSFAEIFGPLVSVLRFQIARHGAATLKDSK
jgi:predicted nucleic acid-binding Zn ribbon protein